MEYVDAGDLESLLESDTFSIENALTVARQVAEALAYSHGEGIVHRDIKPANILIHRNGKAKVTDFGLVKVMGSNRFNTKIGFGTPGYYAPEIEIDGQSDTRSDIYSFGVLLYQMLTGDLPVGMWEPATIVKPELDERFDEVIKGCLKRKPEDRFQSMEEVKKALDDIAFTAPEGTSSLKEIEKRTLKKNLAIVFVSLFAVTAVASVFDIYFNRSHIGWLLENEKPGQRGQFIEKVNIWNGISYILFPAAWAWFVFGLLNMSPGTNDSKKRVLALPKIGAILCAIGWIITIPILFILMRDLTWPTNAKLLFPISVIVKAGIAVPLGYLAVEMVSQRLLYPYYFARDELVDEFVGDKQLRKLGNKGILWIISTSLCPILAFLLLVISIQGFSWFSVIVALVSIGFVLAGGLMFHQMVVLPIRQLQAAAKGIREDNFEVEVEAYRTDEFGDVAREFNRMAAGLREREQLRLQVDQHASGEVAREVKKHQTQQAIQKKQQTKKKSKKTKRRKNK